MISDFLRLDFTAKRLALLRQLYYICTLLNFTMKSCTHVKNYKYLLLTVIDKQDSFAFPFLTFENPLNDHVRSTVHCGVEFDSVSKLQ